MTETTPITIPTEIVNDKDVTLLQWLHQHGEPVQQDAIIAIIETSKTNIEVASPKSGILNHAYPANTDLPAGSTIGYITLSAVNLNTSTPCESNNAENQTISHEIKFSKRALELVTLHNLSPTLFQQLPIFREHDVLQFID